MLNYETNLLDAIIYVSGVAFVFFMIPTLVMFALTTWITNKIERK